LFVVLVASLGCRSTAAKATEKEGTAAAAPSAAATPSETVRIAIGTQDTTINCATAGLIVRQGKLLEQHLPKSGRYQNVKYEIVWKNFTSGPPLTSEMVAGKLDIGMMGDFPAVLNGVALRKSGGSRYIATISGNVRGGGNALVVPKDSPARTLLDLKGKQISVPFGSAAHAMLLRAIRDLNWDPEKDVSLVSQSPEVGGTSLKSGKIDGHADFVPFGELFPFRGFARKIYDGSSVNRPTSHGIVVRSEFADQHPEIVVGYLKSMLAADSLVAKDPEKYSELIQEVTGVEAEVNYMFHGPLGVQTRDYTLKPEFKQGLTIAVETLSLLKRMEGTFDVESFVTDRYIRQAAKELGLDYDARLRSYEKLPLTEKDARTGEPVAQPNHAAQIWVAGEAKVRSYASAASAFDALRELEAQQKRVRVMFVHDHETGVKLLAPSAWYVKAGPAISAFLLKRDAEAKAKSQSAVVLEFGKIKAGKP
jgi:NitT/TauT family transport system substrate-binding protein